MLRAGIPLPTIAAENMVPTDIGEPLDGIERSQEVVMWLTQDGFESDCAPLGARELISVGTGVRKRLEEAVKPVPLLSLLAALLTSVTPALATSPTLELDNGILTLRIDTSHYGGAITWLSPSTSSTNLINNYDRGRQAQQSYYAGNAIDRGAEGQHPDWSPWPWNPIQVGDAYGNFSAVLECDVSSEVIYTKTAPLLWDMNNETAEAWIEQWTHLEENVVHVRCRLTCFRADDRWDMVARHQEMPALYTVSTLCNQYTYVGWEPWTNAPLTRIESVGFPWAYWGPGTERPGAVEGWAANVNDENWGVGVYYGDAELFVGGLYGSCGGSEFSLSTTYLSPLRTISLEKRSTLEYEYDIIVGSHDEIRHHVYANLPKRVGPQRWDFNTDGDFQGWVCYKHITDETVSGGVLSFEVTDRDPQLRSPGNLAIDASTCHWLHVRMRNGTGSVRAQAFWTNQYGGYGTDNKTSITTSADDTGIVEYHVDLSGVETWKGLVLDLRFDPTSQAKSGRIVIDYIALDAKPPSTPNANWFIH